MSSEPDLEAQPGDGELESVTRSFIKNHKTLTLTLVVAVATGAVFVAKVSVDDGDSQQQLDDAANAGEITSMILGVVTAVAEKISGKTEQASGSGARQAAMQAFQEAAVNVEGDTVHDGETYYDYILRWWNSGE